MPPAQPLTAQSMKIFLPSGKDYPQAVAFYQDLGFTVEWQHEDSLSCMALGDCRFLLQNFQNTEMQQNFMMHLMVDDLDAWWQKICDAKLVEKYPGVKAKAPQDYPWGLREIHLIDPAGVLWHIAVPVEKKV